MSDFLVSNFFFLFSARSSITLLCLSTERDVFQWCQQGGKLKGGVAEQLSKFKNWIYTCILLQPNFLMSNTICQTKSNTVCTIICIFILILFQGSLSTTLTLFDGNLFKNRKGESLSECIFCKEKRKSVATSKFMVATTLKRRRETSFLVQFFGIFYFQKRGQKGFMNFMKNNGCRHMQYSCYCCRRRASDDSAYDSKGKE